MTRYRERQERRNEKWRERTMCSVRSNNIQIFYTENRFGSATSIIHRVLYSVYSWIELTRLLKIVWYLGLGCTGSRYFSSSDSFYMALTWGPSTGSLLCRINEICTKHFVCFSGSFVHSFIRSHDGNRILHNILSYTRYSFLGFSYKINCVWCESGYCWAIVAYYARSSVVSLEQNTRREEKQAEMLLLEIFFSWSFCAHSLCVSFFLHSVFLFFFFFCGIFFPSFCFISYIFLFGW